MQAACHLNMATVHHLQKNYTKTINRATLALGLKETIKGFYRRA
jgi:hypothetical protein